MIASREETDKDFDERVQKQELERQERQRLEEEEKLKKRQQEEEAAKRQPPPPEDMSDEESAVEEEEEQEKERHSSVIENIAKAKHLSLKEKQILAQAAFSGASDSESDYDSDIDIKYKLDLKDPFVKDLIAKYKHSSMKSTKKQYGDKIKYLATERLKQSARGLLKRLREAKDMLPVYEALSKQKDVVRP